VRDTLVSIILSPVCISSHASPPMIRFLLPVQNSQTKKGLRGESLPEGTMMTINRMMMPTMMQIRIFMSFHHICLRTRLAPRRKPCADVARLSVLSCRASRRSPRCEALFRLSCIWRTVLSISWLSHALLALWIRRCLERRLGHSTPVTACRLLPVLRYSLSLADGHASLCDCGTVG
jgi:hypothetical protein